MQKLPARESEHPVNVGFYSYAKTIKFFNFQQSPKEKNAGCQNVLSSGPAVLFPQFTVSLGATVASFKTIAFQSIAASLYRQRTC
jgi:hypothetical protein